jgi:hypothetical protein
MALRKKIRTLYKVQSILPIAYYLVHSAITENDRPLFRQLPIFYSLLQPAILSPKIDRFVNF